MNYIIWKGINSNTIPGLIIQELPPITTPPIRYNTVEIDGRDGDIVDELGYGSYDKTLLIGLSYNYNIDQVIKYFSGDGNLILSNEPDKYYKAKILERIDYERLLRFKTAIITFHVQPFKYKYRESPFTLDITNETSYLVTNVGLEYSKPKITLYGSGNVIFTLNGQDIFTINIDSSYVVIDSEEQEAYKESTLKNRQMIGDFPLLKPGVNEITWTGTLTKIIVEPKSRWL